MIFEKVTSCKNGKFYDRNWFVHVICKNTIATKTNGDVLFHYIKNCNEIDLQPIKSLSLTRNFRRGDASGFASVDKIHGAKILVNKNGEACEITDKSLSTYVSKSGYVSRKSNVCRSIVLGNICVRNRGKINYNMPDDKKKVVDNISKTITNLVKQYNLNIYDYMHRRKTLCAPYCFDDSIFSTAILNYDFRTACHVDTNSIRGSYCALVLNEELQNNYDGFLLGFPEYRVAVNVSHGDLLIFDNNEKHCNTDYSVCSKLLGFDALTKNFYAGRLSLSLYLCDDLHFYKHDYKIIITPFHIDILKNKILRFLDACEVPKTQIHIFFPSEYVRNEAVKQIPNLYMIYPNIYVPNQARYGVCRIKNFVCRYFDEGERLIWVDESLENLENLESNCNIKYVAEKGIKEMKEYNCSMFGIAPSGCDLSDSVSTELSEISATFFGTINNHTYHLLHVVDENGGLDDHIVRSCQVYSQENCLIRLNAYASKTNPYNPASSEYVRKMYPNYIKYFNIENTDPQQERYSGQRWFRENPIKYDTYLDKKSKTK